MGPKTPMMLEYMFDLMFWVPFVSFFNLPKAYNLYVSEC